MLITSYTYTFVSPEVVRLSWTATDTTKRCWVFVNGVLIDSLYDTTSASRELEFVVDPDETWVVEIHELSSTEDVSSTIEPRGTYRIQWFREDDAIYYNVYHSVEDGSEGLMTRINQTPDNEIYHVDTSELEWIDGVWHHFRVESVNETGLESTRRQWHYFVYGVPSFPVHANISGSGGTFNIGVAL